MESCDSEDDALIKPVCAEARVFSDDGKDRHDSPTTGGFFSWRSSPKQESVFDVLKSISVAARTGTRSKTHTESWCKGLLNKVASQVGLSRAEKKSYFTSTKTRDSSMWQVLLCDA